MDAWLHPIYFGSMSVCLNIPNFAFEYIDHGFSKYDFDILTSDSLLLPHFYTKKNR